MWTGSRTLLQKAQLNRVMFLRCSTEDQAQMRIHCRKRKLSKLQAALLSEDYIHFRDDLIVVES